MGLHTLYQKRGLPFKSSQARGLNIETHQWISNESETASRELAARFGEPEWCVGSGLRHSHLLAIAPTRTNSVISGAFSQGVEPIDPNYFVAKQAKGTYVRKNPVLEQLLCDRGVDDSIWEQILEAKGLKPIDATNQPFDFNLHEAIANVPVEDEALKGKVIDQVEKGYYLNEKVIRFAKVAVGQ
jgi:ribonucleotide reductase alpha subunit